MQHPPLPPMCIAAHVYKQYHQCVVIFMWNALWEYNHLINQNPQSLLVWCCINIKTAQATVILRYILLYFLEEAYLNIEGGLLLSVVLCTARGFRFLVLQCLSQASLKQFSSLVVWQICWGIAKLKSSNGFYIKFLSDWYSMVDMATGFV